MGSSMQLLRIFSWSTPLIAISLIISAVYGGWNGLAIVGIVAIFQIAMLYEVAVGNVVMLKQLPVFWQKVFIRIGLPLAIFVVQLVFPVAIVSIIAWCNPVDVVELALTDPMSYKQMITDAHPVIAAFVGTFLLMSFLEVFFDERKTLWLQWLEKKLVKVGRPADWAKWALFPVDQFGLILMIMLTILQHYKDYGHHAYQYGGEYADLSASVFWGGVIGFILYQLIEGFSEIFRAKFVDRAQRSRPEIPLVTTDKRMSFFVICSLMVLNVQFSFYSMIGALAITNDIVSVTNGLGLGAMIVWLLTVYWVRQVKWTSSVNIRHNGENYEIERSDSYRIGQNNWVPYDYITHGVSYAVGVLAVLMLFTVQYHIPELVIGVASVALIVASYISSVRRKRELAKAELSMNN
jgi:hypothetical protein